MKTGFLSLLVSQAFLSAVFANQDVWSQASYSYIENTPPKINQPDTVSQAVLEAHNQYQAVMNTSNLLSLTANNPVTWTGNYQIAGINSFGTIQPWISGTTTTNWNNNATPQPTDDTFFTTSANSGVSEVFVYVNQGGSPQAPSYANSLNIGPNGSVFNFFADLNAVSPGGSGVNTLYISPSNANGITLTNGTAYFYAINLNFTTGTIQANNGANLYFGPNPASPVVPNTTLNFSSGTAGTNLNFSGSSSGTVNFIGNANFNFTGLQNINFASGNFIIDSLSSTLIDNQSNNLNMLGGNILVKNVANFANPSNGVNITGGLTTIQNATGNILSPGVLFGMTGGSVVITGATCAANTPKFVMEGGYLSLDGNSSLGSGGTTAIAFVGGNLLNNGTIFASDPSYFAINPNTGENGNFSGMGQVISNGLLSITIPVTQGSIVSTSGVLDATGPINATVSVTTGKIRSGQSDPTQMKITQSLLLNNATASIYVAREKWTEFEISNQLDLTGSNVVKIDELNAHWRNTQYFPIFTYDQQIGGSFTSLVNEFKYYSYLLQEPKVTYLVVDFPPPVAIFKGNIAGLAAGLNNVSGDCTPQLQDIIDELGFLPLETQKIVLNQMLPQFKLIQFSMEKLFYSLQDEVKLLGNFQKEGPRVFVKAGYDYYNQNAKPMYNGFNINSYYQMAGLSYGQEDMSYSGAIGASESYFKFDHFPAHADYDSVYASLSALGHQPHFEWGVSGTYGWSFIRSLRNIDYFSEKAKSAHNAWMAILEGDLGYILRWTNTSFKIYDRVGFVYGKELKYRENHADALNLVVKNEALFYLRNTLGFYFDFFSKDHYKGYLDTAWVYEAALKSNTYTYRFINTNQSIKDVPIYQTPNYAKLGIGFEAQFKPVDFQLNYHVLFNHTFIEHNASIMLGKQF